MRPQKYRPELGIQGNIENTLWENQYRKNEIYNNDAKQTANHTATEDALCEIDSIDRIAEIEEALCELDERIGGNL